MLLCGKCKRKITSLYGCCVCQRAFCYQHVTPGEHQCSRLSQVLRFWKRDTEKSTRRANNKFQGPFQPTPLLFLVLILSSAILLSINYQFCSKALRDPTLEEARRFISLDLTDENLYKEGRYTCVHFAKEFKANAEKAGYKCGYVVVFFADSSHALNCFNTTDIGLVYVEPQLDRILNLTIGYGYWDISKYVPLPSRGYNDTITGYLVNW